MIRRRAVSLAVAGAAAVASLGIASAAHADIVPLGSCSAKVTSYGSGGHRYLQYVLDNNYDPGTRATCKASFYDHNTHIYGCQSPTLAPLGEYACSSRDDAYSLQISINGVLLGDTW